MKGVSYITDDKNKRTAVLIELKTIEKHQDELEDFLEGIIAESRKNDEKVPLADVITNLKKAGKLN